ncbi:MAG TPA: aspartate--tRNA(Asn) ligase [Acidimicrobiales bacterium]|nr:aspartate--tRNA(Asn) ligase [Acidimicrobiales bacterium]
MQRIMSSELGSHAGERVALAGWVHHQRHLAQVSFLLLRDAHGISQVVVDDGSTHDLVAESVVAIQGTVVAAPQAPGGFELHDPTVQVLSATSTAPPFELRRPDLNAQLPTLLDHASVSLRHPPIRAGLSIAAASLAGFRSTLDGLGFTEIQTPKIVATATESGANVFGIDYFGRPAYLAQSPQLYKQVMVGVFERVYETGPVFRAEPHDTTRHLAEYVSLDVELGFIDDHRDVERVLREVLAGMVETVSVRAASAVDLLGIELPVVPAEIPVIHFADAQVLLERALGEAVVGEPDLAPAHERWLGEWARAEHGSDFLFVEGYPMVKRPFYTHPDPARPAHSNSFDLLFRGIELVTGGQRLHRYEDYLTVLDEPTRASLDGYLEAFRHGMPRHGGFAIGLERWTARLVGAVNVREVTLFPRDRDRLTP